MYGNKLLLNEASRFDPQLEPKYLRQFLINYFIEIFDFLKFITFGRKLSFFKRVFSLKPPANPPPAACAEILIPHHFQR